MHATEVELSDILNMVHTEKARVVLMARGNQGLDRQQMPGLAVCRIDLLAQACSFYSRS